MPAIPASRIATIAAEGGSYARENDAPADRWDECLTIGALHQSHDRRLAAARFASQTRQHFSQQHRATLFLGQQRQGVVDSPLAAAAQFEPAATELIEAHRERIVRLRAIHPPSLPAA